MGQKCNPIGLRLGITQTHRSRWYAKKRDFGQYLLEDFKIRRYIKTSLDLNMAGIPRIDIERNGDVVRVIIFTASPGMLIGKRGKNVEKLTEDMEKLVGHKVELKIEEVKDPLLEAQLAAEAVAEQLEKRAQYRRIMRKVAESIMENGALGVRLRLSGRLGGAEIARVAGMSLGKLPLHTFRADIDYGAAEALLGKGLIGIKVWIYKGDILVEKKKNVKETPNENDAETGQV